MSTFSHGSQLVSTDIARDCQVGRTTVDGYLKILEDLMIGVRLPVFSSATGRVLDAKISTSAAHVNRPKPIARHPPENWKWNFAGEEIAEVCAPPMTLQCHPQSVHFCNPRTIHRSLRRLIEVGKIFLLDGNNFWWG